PGGGPRLPPGRRGAPARDRRRGRRGLPGRVRPGIRRGDCRRAGRQPAPGGPRSDRGGYRRPRADDDRAAAARAARGTPRGDTRGQRGGALRRHRAGDRGHRGRPFAHRLAHGAGLRSTMDRNDPPGGNVARPSLGELGATVARLLRTAGQTVAVAESPPGGVLGASLRAVPGASAWFLGGGVVYAARSRRGILGIRAEDVAGLEPLTEPMAARFAEFARRRLGADWGLAELGIAGPT